ncbi:MAG: hypothetical protein U1F36_13695 [Planctomycetota bacterium]
MIERRWPRFAVALAVTLVVSSLSAQGDVFTRRRCRGVVHDAEGRPAAGAQVHFRLAPPSALLTEALADPCEALADDQGRFHAELITGREYVLWAELRSPDGSTHLSEIWPAHCGAIVKPDLLPTATLPTRLHVTGFTSTDMRLRLLDPQIHQIDVVPLAADGDVELPPRPPSLLAIEVLHGDKLLACGNATSGAQHEIAPLHGRMQRMLVVDTRGQALQGVEMTVDFAGKETVLATSDATGQLELAGFRPGLTIDGIAALLPQLPGVFRAPKVRRAWIGLGELLADANSSDAPFDRTFTLQGAATSPTPPVLLLGTSPLQHATLLAIESAGHVSRTDNSVIDVERILHTDREGIGEDPELFHALRSLRIVKDRETLSRLPPEWRPTATCLIGFDLPPPAKLDEGVDLRSLLLPVDVDVVMQDGSTPAADTLVWVGSSRDGATPAGTDAAGRIRLLISTAEHGPLLIGCCNEAGYAVARIDGGSKPAPRPEVERLALQLGRTVRLDLAPPQSPGNPALPPRCLAVRTQLQLDRRVAVTPTKAPEERAAHASVLPMNAVEGLLFASVALDRGFACGPQFTLHLPPVPCKVRVQADSAYQTGSAVLHIEGHEESVQAPISLHRR